MTEEKFEDYIYVNMLYLKLIGLWPTQESDTVWTIYMHKFRLFLYAFFLWILLLVPLLIDIYFVWGNTFAILQNLCMTIHAFAACYKYTHVAANQTNFKVLLQCNSHIQSH